MAEKKKGKKRKEEFATEEEPEPKPSKDEYSVAKWLRKNVPIKKTKFLNHNVEYFTGSKAVDGLLESKWSTGDTPLFKSRQEIVDLLHLMLEHKFFHRARKVPVSEQELRPKKKDKKSLTAPEEKKKEKKSLEAEEKKKDDREKKDNGEKGTDAENSVAEGKSEPMSDKEKRKRKVRLEMHNDQRFVDGLDAYVWIYDPIPFYYWIIGALLVLGAIGICLFPLWPPSVRLGVYYLSVAAAAFLVFIIVLVVLRFIIFCVVWICTVGKHHIWILPNLTEDVGFFASFWPLYKYEYKGADANSKNGNKKEKKKKKDKDSDAEMDQVDDKKEVESTTESSTLRHRKVSKQITGDDDVQSENGTNTDGGSVELIGNNGSESESETSQRSSTGKDFEMVDQDDIEES